MKLNYNIGFKKNDDLILVDFLVMSIDSHHSCGCHLTTIELTKEADIKKLYQLRNEKYPAKSSNGNLVYIQYLNSTLRPSWFTLRELFDIQMEMSNQYMLWLHDIESLARFSGLFDSMENTIILTTIEN